VHQGLVVAEIALAVILLAGAGLLMRSFLRVQATNRGFDSRNVLLLQVDLPGTYNTTEKQAAFFSEATRRIRSLPGVVAVGAISDFFIHRQPDYRIALEGQPPRSLDDPAPPLTEDQIVPGYFEAMRIPLLRGRLLQDSDLAKGAPPAVVINEEMARRFWPDQDPVGRRFKYGANPAADMPWKTVVGVVANMRRQRLDEPAIPYMFQPGVLGQMDMAIRTAGDPAALRDAIRAEMRALDPTAPPYGIVTVEQRLGRTVALRRLQTLLLLGLAAVALVLSMIGAYGVIHQSVASRTQEIGIRMALGANSRAVRRMVLTSGLAPAAAGAALGLAGSLALSRTLGTFLYETNPIDPLVYVAVTGLLLTVTTLACLLPASRAARFDPMAALRNQ
jgi:predicted permease